MVRKAKHLVRMMCSKPSFTGFFRLDTLALLCSDLQSRDRATPRCKPSRSTTRAPAGRIEVEYDEEFQIQKQSTTLWWTNANYDEIKNDAMTEQNTMTVEFEEIHSRDGACLFQIFPVPDNGGRRAQRGTDRVAKHHRSKGGRTHLRVGQKDGRDCACLFQLLPVPVNGRCRIHSEIEQVAKRQGSKD